MGTLYIVATPIGNLQDVSPRVIETLQSVNLIACEDTRHTVKLLNHFGIQKPLQSYHDFNEQEKADALVKRLLAGDNIALVSDAGTPAISDPGYRVVRACREKEIPIVAIAGPSALTAALSASGLPSDEFLFAGFLPAKAEARRRKLRELRDLTCTLVFYEAPHRIEAMLEDLLEILGDREACVAREITKIHEAYVFGRLAEIQTKVKAVGEFVVIVAGGPGGVPAPPPATRDEVLKKLGMSRNQLYDLFFKKNADS